MQHYIKNKPYKSKSGIFYRLYEDRGLGNVPRYGIEEFNCGNWVLLVGLITNDRIERNTYLHCILTYENTETENNEKERIEHGKQRITVADWQKTNNHDF